MFTDIAAILKRRSVFIKYISCLYCAGIMWACGTTDTGEKSPIDVCGELSKTHDFLFCSHRISDEDTWAALSAPSSKFDQVTLTKYVMAADDTLPVPLSFMNVNIHPLHYDFLIAAFPENFEGVSPVQYLHMATNGEARSLIVGDIALYFADGKTFYGFTVLDDSANPELVIRFDQVRLLYRELSSRFTIGELTFVPETSAQIEMAKSSNVNFPVARLADIEYEVYTVGEGFGTVRILDANGLQQAESSGLIGFQDILVLDEAPSDLERIVSGTVTGTRQGMLSHLNVRSNARGTPNCFVARPRVTLRKWEGQLVRMVCGQDALLIETATPEEAQAAWQALRPNPVVLRPVNTDFNELTPLLLIPTQSTEERLAAVDRFGAKAANLAVLYQRIDPALQLSGFSIPFYYYNQFMEQSRWDAPTDSGTQELSFAQTLVVWLQEEDFTSNPTDRQSRLLALQSAMRDAEVDENLLDLLGRIILEVFGSDTVMVRFRSSSNAEDALTFSGAGLYNSTSACLADETDGDTAGPSQCDSDQSNERELSRALKKVWASLWNPAAYEERAWYGIDHLQTAMGILVNTRTKNEAANIVAFTGNPITGEPDYLINAQLGELDVVSSDPGIYPETSLLEMNGGEVSEIRRISASSQTVPGESVITDDLLRKLGVQLADIADRYPLDATVPAESVLFYDTEWKLTEVQELIIKQIRPFLH
jgi:pyruvate,water dikinase